MSDRSRSPKTHHLQEMHMLEKELNEELLWLEQEDKPVRLKTEPSTTAASSYNSKKIIQMKPTAHGFKVCELRVAQQHPKQQSKFSNKENRPANIVKQKQQKKGSVGRDTGKEVKLAPKRNNENDKRMPEPRLLIEEYESDRLFEDHQQGSYDNGLFKDDTLKLDGDSIDFEVREINNTDRVNEVDFQSQPTHFISLKDCMKSINLKENKNAHNGSLQCTFKPKILQKSKKLAERLEPSFDRLTARGKKSETIGYQQSSRPTKKYSQQRLQNLSRPRQTKQKKEEEEDSQHSFRPTLSRKSLKQLQYCELDIVARNEIWLKQKQMKIHKLREEEKNRKLTESNSKRISISPNQYKRQKDTTMSKFIKDGLNEHFERLQQASNIKKHTQEAELRYSGKGWNGAITKPKQFKLSGTQKDRGRIISGIPKSVQKEYEKAVKELQQKIKRLNI